MSYSDPFDLVGQQREQANAMRRFELAERIEIEDLKWLMADKRGRRFVARLIDTAGVGRPSIDQNTAAMAFKEGKRWYGALIVETLMKHCFDEYMLMLKEVNEWQTKR